MNGFVDEKKVFHLEIPVLETDADVFEHADELHCKEILEATADLLKEIGEFTRNAVEEPSKIVNEALPLVLG